MADKFLLLVEGKDDEHVLYQLLEHHQVPMTFRIKEKKGIENLLKTLYAELDAGGLERLGVVIDADTAPSSRWEAIRNIFRQAGCPLPDTIEATGAILNLSGSSEARRGLDHAEQ